MAIAAPAGEQLLARLQSARGDWLEELKVALAIALVGQRSRTKVFGNKQSSCTKVVI